MCNNYKGNMSGKVIMEEGRRRERGSLEGYVQREIRTLLNGKDRKECPSHGCQSNPTLFVIKNDTPYQ